MGIEIKELVIRATVDSERSCEGRDHSDSARQESRRINNMHVRIQELARMINQKNER